MINLYIAAILGVITIEMIYYSNHQKRWESFSEYWLDRWDNLAVAFLGAMLLCFTYPDLAEIVKDKTEWDLTTFPKAAGLVIGLASTPIIYWIKSFIGDKLEKNG